MHQSVRIQEIGGHNQRSSRVLLTLLENKYWFQAQLQATFETGCLQQQMNSSIAQILEILAFFFFRDGKVSCWKALEDDKNTQKLGILGEK